MLVGVTGSLAALGDTLFPAASLSSALIRDFSVSGGWLVRWRWTHPAIALAASVFLLWLLVRAFRTSGQTHTEHNNNRRLAALILLLLAVVYLLGLLDVALLAPVWAQVAHLLGADSLWVALVVLTARLTIVSDHAES
jgi:cytochrome c oxidase assembly protein subunit 15